MRRLVVPLIALLVLALAPSARAAAPERVSGASRFDTAVAIALRAFPDEAATVYLARADVLDDAVVAGTLTDGPVLLVPSCGELPDVVIEAIARLDPMTVTALGGHAAVCDQLLDDAAEGRERERLFGASRYDTAVAISEASFPDVAETVYVARAAASPDAVAGGALTDGPILLVPPAGEVPDQVAAEIDRLDPERVVALGGPGAVPQEALDAAAGDRPTDRLAGRDRFATAAAIAEEAFGDDSGTVYLARADVFADAVAARSPTARCCSCPPAVRSPRSSVSASPRSSRTRWSRSEAPVPSARSCCRLRHPGRRPRSSPPASLTRPRTSSVRPPPGRSTSRGPAPSSRVRRTSPGGRSPTATRCS